MTETLLFTKQIRLVCLLLASLSSIALGENNAIKRIVLISDLHGQTKELKVPQGDILIFAGDMSRTGQPGEIADFNNWLGTLPHPVKIVIAGNHDLALDRARFPTVDPRKLLTNAIYLDHESIRVDGINIFGSPYSPQHNDWAFQLRGKEHAKQMWALIPPKTDILIVHGPPKGYGDQLATDNREVGCAELLARIDQIKPMLVVSGHIHEGFGIRKRGNTWIINASILGQDRRPTNAPIVFDFPTTTSH